MVCYSLGKTLSYSKHSLVVCSSFPTVEASWALSPFHISVSIGIILVQVRFRQPCWWDFIWVVSLTFLGNTSSWQSPLALTIFPVHSSTISLRSGCSCVVDTLVGTGLYSFAFWPFVIFLYWYQSAWKRSFLGEGCEQHVPVGIK